MTIESHVKFDLIRSQTNRLVLSAREQQAAFWAEMTHKSPSLKLLDKIGSDIGKHMRQANDNFQRLLKINPNSVSTLRSYAEFLAEVPARGRL